MNKIVVLLCCLFFAAWVQAGVKEDIQADMKAGHWVEADTKLVKVLKDHPDNALAHYWMAQVKAREGLPTTAREHLEKAKKLKPDLSFASSPQAVAELEKHLTPATVKTPPGGDLKPHAAAPAPVTAPVKESGGHGMFFWLLVLIIPIGLIWFFMRGRSGPGASSDVQQQRNRLHEQLKDVSAELRDAEKALDIRQELNAEQKMAFADRISQAQGDVARESSALNTRTDFEPTYGLIMRVRDIAAEARGEEKPSLRLERERQMAAQQQPQMQPGYAQQPQSPGIGSGLLAGAAGLAAGVAIGSMMSGSSHAATRDRSHSSSSDDGFEPISGSDNSSSSFGNVDFGNDSSSSSDWSSDSSSTDFGSDSSSSGGDDW